MTTESQTVQKFELPTIFVIFGITGDLVKKKILKSLYHLYHKNLLPKKFRLYGISRREYTHDKLREYLREIMQEKKLKHAEKYDEFLENMYYIQGDFNGQETYRKLSEVLGRADDGWRVCSNKLFYLAVPPSNYSAIIENLNTSGLTEPCSPEEGWTRVILEKPFGTNLETATKLDMQLGKLFKEEQIYRVDHYLAKETVRNILAFRFSNIFLQPAWNKNHIAKIHVRLCEKGRVEERGGFYDEVGALRDVGQNHLLQLLALFIMDQPKSFAPSEIKKQRSKALQSLKLFSHDEAEKYASRGQYAGYQKEKGVADDSQTETYFKICAFSTSPDFEGVPLILESGKGMRENITEVQVEFKHPSTKLFEIQEDQRNTLHYSLSPVEKISLEFLVKKPGFTFAIQEHELSFRYRDAHGPSEFIDDYEALLFDIIRGDQTLFVSTEEIISEWKFIQPVLEAWEKGKPELFAYEAGEEVRAP